MELLSIRNKLYVQQTNFFSIPSSLSVLLGTSRWGEYGEGGLLWAECNSRNFEWFESDPLTGLLLKVFLQGFPIFVFFIYDYIADASFPIGYNKCFR